MAYLEMIFEFFDFDHSKPLFQLSVISDQVPVSLQSGRKKKVNREPTSFISNFFVFQNYTLRFSGFFCLNLKRSFPVSFVLGTNLSTALYISIVTPTQLPQLIPDYKGSTIGKLGTGQGSLFSYKVWCSGWFQAQNTPEMNVSD